MYVQKSGTPTGFDRLNALLAWWGTQDAHRDPANIETQTERFRMLVIELNRAFNEASCCQLEALSTTNERLAQSLQYLLRGPQPQELMAVQSSIVAGLLESLAIQTKVWADLMQKVHDCCTAMLAEARQQPSWAGRIELQREAGLSAG